jgi:hypothetical protein
LVDKKRILYSIFRWHAANTYSDTWSPVVRFTLHDRGSNTTVLLLLFLIEKKRVGATTAVMRVFPIAKKNYEYQLLTFFRTGTAVVLFFLRREDIGLESSCWATNVCAHSDWALTFKGY